MDADNNFDWGKVHSALLHESCAVDQPHPLSGKKVAIAVAHALFEQAQNTGKLTFQENDVERVSQPFWGLQEPDVGLVLALIRGFDFITGKSSDGVYSFKDKWPAVRSEIKEAARSIANSADEMRLGVLTARQADRQLVELQGNVVGNFDHGMALLEASKKGAE